MTALEMAMLHDLLERWQNEATQLMNTHGYENHSRASLTKRHIREILEVFSIPGDDECVGAE